MSDPEAGLLRAILDDPDDDAVRLVYADYLEERGDPRGEFIRLQVLSAQAGDAEKALAERAGALLAEHLDEWTKGVGPFDRERVSLHFQRGFLEGVSIKGGTDEDLAILERIPGLQFLNLESCDVTEAGLALVAGLRHLRSLSCEYTEIGEDGLRVLEALPCWTRVRICDGGFDEDGAIWRGFQERRIGKLASLGPQQRRQAALWFLNALLGNTQPARTITRVRLCQESLDDAEMRFFAEVPELEEIDLYQPYGLTGAGLQHLAGLPRLKVVSIWKAAVDSIRPLTTCLALERLQVHGNPWGTVIRDEGTEGLDRLTNLRILHLESEGLADATVARLRPLRQLRELTLEVGPLDDEGCLDVLSGLTELETLSINRYAWSHSRGRGFRDDVLRHLAPLRRLHTLYMPLDRGSGEGLRHLAGLSELRFLALSGEAVTDAGLRHLGSLRNLRTLMAQPSAISEAGARALAGRLPAVTIITMDHVVKSPRAALAFCRRRAAEWASALIPEDWWGEKDGNIRTIEDGWEHITSWSGRKVGRAEIGLSARDKWMPVTAEAELRAWVQSNAHLNPRVLEDGLVTWPGWQCASCIYANDFGQHLTCVAVRGPWVVVLNCSAPPARFEEFRPLFLFVARSVRLGDAAQEGGGERIEVPAAELR